MGGAEKIKNGTKFKICTHEELMKKGWAQDGSTSQSSYEHEDYHGVITFMMIENNQGKTLTVKAHHRQNWYAVEENEYMWPVNEFEEIFFKVNIGHFCIEGMTPIDGFFICKTCGNNLREIK